MPDAHAMPYEASLPPTKSWKGLVGKVEAWQTVLAEQMRHGGTKKIVGSITDLTDVKQLETQLVQAQKMEALGRLTGGIAHDFNNLLLIILGNLNIALKDLEPGSEEHVRVKKAIGASRRGAEMIRQLMAFSRIQVLQPEIVDLSVSFKDTVGLLEHILGEQIEISIALGDELWPVNIDPGRLDNSIFNLASNARDAMPKGGKLTFGAENVELEEETDEEGDVLAGRFVKLTVTDNGSGMPERIRKRAFEPFFTTKAVGQGSGLGLSMVYGFVKQSGGMVTLRSEEGVGTAFELYLPAAEPDDKAAITPE